MLEGIVNSKKLRRPRRVLIYGTHGIGKSTFGSCAPKPIFVPTEDGLSDLNVNTFPVAKTYGEFMENLQKVAIGEHEFESVVIDSADWLESLIWAQVCSDGGKQSIDEFGFGKGYGHALHYWDCAVNLLTACRERADNGIGPAMMVIIIAHAKVQRFEDPQTEPYDRYEPNLHKSASAMLQEWVDEVLFCRQRVVTVGQPGNSKKDDTNNKYRGMTAGERIIYTTEQPSHLAKRHLPIPNELPLAFAAYWDAAQQAQAEVDAACAM